MAVIVIGSDRFAYEGRLAPVLPVTGWVERFLAAEPCAEEAEVVAHVMLECARGGEGRFALLRGEGAVHVLITHPGPAAAAAYHARLAAEHGTLLDELAAEWDTDHDDPALPDDQAEDCVTYATLTCRD